MTSADRLELQRLNRDIQEGQPLPSIETLQQWLAEARKERNSIFQMIGSDNWQYKELRKKVNRLKQAIAKAQYRREALTYDYETSPPHSPYFYGPTLEENTMLSGSTIQTAEDFESKARKDEENRVTAAISKGIISQAYSQAGNMLNNSQLVTGTCLDGICIQQVENAVAAFEEAAAHLKRELKRATPPRSRRRR